MDSLCGLYAIVNAIRYLLGPDSFNPTKERLLFHRLIAETAKRLDLSAAITAGIDSAPRHRLAKMAVRHCRVQVGVSIKADRPYVAARNSVHDEIFGALQAEAKRGDTVFILALMGRYNHRSVCVTANAIARLRREALTE